MKKTLKLALLPAAVASAMFANNAFAGTEACFEVYKGADALPVAAFSDIYDGASCVAEADRGGAAADDLEATDEGKIAYELTADLDVSLDALDGTNTDQHIIYIPTTDIPGGTKIEMKVTGATFKGNSNQIHLVRGNTTDTTFEAVASSDGQVDGESTITFLTKSGVTIGAGTRLAFSLVSTGADWTAVAPIGFHLANDVCTDGSSTQTVLIKSVSAKTDGGTGYDIIGGISSNQAILDVSPQFYTFQSTETADAEVNAESSSHISDIIARTEFVYDPAEGVDKLEVQQHQVIFAAGFHDRGTALDRAITLDADDHLVSSFTSSAAAGDSVVMNIFNGQTTGTGVVDTAIDVETGTTSGDLVGTSYNTEAVDIFTPEIGAGSAENNPFVGGEPQSEGLYNKVFYTLENSDAAAVMNFNYDVEIQHELTFNEASYLDHCQQEITSHDIDVNGAVLKVPYAYNTSNNWVRITNEHSESAEVTVDVFGESADGTAGTVKKTLVLGTVGSQDSQLYRANEIVAEYLAAGGDAAANRYTFTFTVTAPRDSVHGVSVQAIPGGVDRVMPVLD